MVKADVEFTHSNQLVIGACFLYTMAINHLLSNTTDPNRAKHAFNYVLELSKSDLVNFEDPETKESCLKWL